MAVEAEISVLSEAENQRTKTDPQFYSAASSWHISIATTMPAQQYKGYNIYKHTA